MAHRYFGVSTLVAKIYRTVGGLFSKDQRSDEAKQRQKERAALLQRFKNQDADRARAAAALKAEARALAKRREQGPSPKSNNSN
jgi:hypothetical protein